ncbi:MAG TPA: 30S ribosomal protein S16, partial [Deltaproteobacteria bacterium]|nr:30S ribosomal protein S16 [Deltaproteobacteria bacterium]
RKQRDGRALEIIGHYDPRKETGKLTYNKERLDFWINRGAVLSDSISNLLKDTSVS